MRHECTLPDYTDCWVEVSEKWTRGEERQLAQATDTEWLALWQRKVLACNLRTVDGEYITAPADVTWDALDTLDVGLAGFVGGVMAYTCRELRYLGNASRRASFTGQGPAKTPA